MSTRHHSTTTTQPFRGSGVVEGGGFAVQFPSHDISIHLAVSDEKNKHVSGIDAWTVHPRVVEIGLSSFNQHDLKIMVQIGQTASDNTSAHHQQHTSDLKTD